MNVSRILEALHDQLIFLKVRIYTHFPDMVLALGILIGGYIVYKATAGLLKSLLARSNVQNAFSRLLIDNVYKFVIAVFALILAAGQLGINITAPLAGLGILGLAVGFAAQDSLSNIIAGFLIFFDKPFRVGDYVTINDHYGRVELITMRSTRIRTQDNKYVVIPNQKIINEILTDHTTNGETRLIVPVTIAYETSLPEARTAILREVTAIEGLLETPAPDVVLDMLGESGMELQVRFWIPSAVDERKYHFIVTEAVQRALTQADIEIAYPHLQLVRK